MSSVGSYATDDLLMSTPLSMMACDRPTRSTQQSVQGAVIDEGEEEEEEGVEVVHGHGARTRLPWEESEEEGEAGEEGGKDESGKEAEGMYAYGVVIDPVTGAATVVQQGGRSTRTAHQESEDEGDGSDPGQDGSWMFRSGGAGGRAEQLAAQRAALAAEEARSEAAASHRAERSLPGDSVLLSVAPQPAAAGDHPPKEQPPSTNSNQPLASGSGSGRRSGAAPTPVGPAPHPFMPYRPYPGEARAADSLQPRFVSPAPTGMPIELGDARRPTNMPGTCSCRFACILYAFDNIQLLSVFVAFWGPVCSLASCPMRPGHLSLGPILLWPALSSAVSCTP